MADVGLSAAQEKAIFLELLKRDFAFKLNLDKKSDIALTGFAKDFSYASNKANFSYVLAQLVSLGIPAKDAFWSGTTKPLVTVGQEGPLKLKFTVITVYKSHLREFVEKTGVDFPGKKELFPDLA